MNLFRLKSPASRGIESAKAALLDRDSFSAMPGLKEIEFATSSKTADAEFDMEAPIFLFATGWRTGSTLLQRVLVSDPGLILWGEPLGRLGIIQRLTETVAGFERRIAPDQVTLRHRMTEASESWIANLYPEMHAFRRAMQSFVYTYLGKPAKDIGYERWGMKEVRLGYEDAAVLHWLFPRARFVVVTRDPRAGYRSAMQFGPVWERWPDRRINNPYSYGRLWNRLAVSWQSAPEAFPVRLLRLEDVINGSADLDGLSDFCGLQLKPESALKKKVGAGRPDDKLSVLDRMFINRATRTGRDQFGYP